MRGSILALVAAVPLFAQPQLPTIHDFQGSIGAIGNAFELMGDIDQDGVPEIATTDRWAGLIYVPQPYPCTSCYYPAEQNGIRVFSGRTGALLFSHDDPLTAYQTSSRYQVADAGDLDFDGKPDVAWSYDNVLRVMSTQNGAVLRQWTFGELTQSQKITVVGMQDCDGDGIRDLAVGEPVLAATGAGRVRIFSGATGNVIRIINEPSVGSSPSGFGKALAAVDLNGDQVTDLVVGAPAYNGGKCIAFSGATGAVLWTRTSPLGTIQLGSSLAVAGDVNGDGVPDIVAGAKGWTVSGRVMILSGANGTVINTVIGPSIGFGTVVSGGYDVNGDGTKDIAVGDGDSNHTVYLYGANGAPLATYTLPGTGYGYTARISPDLNGDGYGEIITSNLGSLRVEAYLGASAYGNQGGALGLSWTPGAAVPSLGQLAVSGASPSGAGLIAVSQAGQPASGTPPAEIQIELANLILVQPVAFDAAGAYALSVNLHDAALAGLPFYLQAADLGPAGVTTSNGLQLLFH